MSSSQTCLLALCVLPLALTAADAARPRVIVTTDGEIDDRCSMIRFLLYANEWDIRGLIHSSSKYHWLGDENHERNKWEDVSWLDRQIDAYAQVHPNLVLHDAGYPTPDHLRSQVYVGNIAYEGDMAAATPGSQRIVEVLLENDPSPVWLQVWGGANTIARALKTIDEQHPERHAEVAAKARLVLIAEQDDTLREYILKAWPDATVLLNQSFPIIAYAWQRMMLPADQAWFDGAWMKAHLLEGHGPLCAMYEARDDGSFRSEGDSPAFMHLIDVGLGSHLDPSYGGWGGRYVRGNGLWVTAPERYDSILRWARAFQNDWAARADWCVQPFDAANHRPRAVCNGDDSQAVLTLDVAPGQAVRLSATGSVDPDGDALGYRWSTYVDAGSYWAPLPIEGEATPEATVTVPADAAGRSVHVLLTLTDAGEPPLTSYRRVILNVSGEPTAPPEDPYLTTPITSLSGPPAETGPWSFHRGINLNGPALTLDGHAWEAGDAPGLECEAKAAQQTKVPLRPATDAARAQMLGTFRWDTRFALRVPDVPAGTYAVYAYVWEDNQSEQLTFSLNGEVRLVNHATGNPGEWHRLGPWTATPRKGVLELTSVGGAANVSGIEVWRRDD